MVGKAVEMTEYIPTLLGALLIWQQEAAECDAPQEVLAFNLEKVALVVPDRAVARALKRAAKAARAENTPDMLCELEVATRCVVERLPDGYIPELWKLVHQAPSTAQ
jgi:hypothetical protein